MLRVFLLVASFFFGQLAFSQDWVDFKNLKEAEIDWSEYKEQEAPILVTSQIPLNRSIIANNGFKVLRKLDESHYIVLPIDVSKNTLNHSLRYWSINHQWKLSKGASISKGKSVFILQSTDPSKLLRDSNLEVISTKFDLTKVRASSQYIQKTVATWEEVLSITLAAKNPIPESNVLDLNLNPNKINAVHHFYPELTGEGYSISIQESSFDDEDQDLQGRGVIDMLSSELLDNHATEMATIAAGAGNTFVTGKGVAWRAQLYSSDFADILPDQDIDYVNRNIWVQNHSYGTDIESTYGAEARAYDLSANNNGQLLHVFSSGNSGNSSPLDGAYAGIDGFSNLTGNYKFSKNTLVVGSVDTLGTPISFSSAGPTFDGRVKPELVAYSTVGSSNSAALVSGLSILMQQAYESKFNEIPRSDLVKAVLINTADDVNLANVDFKTGFGNVNGLKAIEAITSENHIQETVSADEVHEYVIEIPANTKNLKITLVWNDPAGEIGSSNALVNDLDLRLKQEEVTYLPWVLDENAALNSLSSPAARKKDALNNVEQVTLELFEPGEYTIEVEGFDVSQGPQSYSLVYSWEEADAFRWTNPLGSSNFPYNGETGTYFRWESTLSEETGVLQYSLNDGVTWIDIDEVDLTQGYHRWQPQEITSIAIARMVIGNQEFETDEFVISQPLRMTVGFNCDDSVLIQWPASEVIDQYDLTHLDGNFLRTVNTLTDTSVVLDKSAFNTTLFGLQPYIADKPAIMSRTFDIERQGVGCFVATFFSNTIDTGIELVLSLGTTYGVSSVTFERVLGDNSTTVAEVIPDSTNVVFVDTNPEEGFNRHRATVNLINGQKIVTDLSEAYYLSDLPFLVFPNPISGFGTLSIFSKNFDGEVPKFSLYNNSGSLVLEKDLNAEFDFIDFNGLNPGIYFYSIKTRDYFSTAKIIVQ